MENIYKYDYFNDWIACVEDYGYSIESWGMFGSKSAHDVNGKIVGEWVVAADTSYNRAGGWVDIDPDHIV